MAALGRALGPCRQAGGGAQCTHGQRGQIVCLAGAHQARDRATNYRRSPSRLRLRDSSPLGGDRVLNPSASGASPVPAPLGFPSSPSSLSSAPHTLEAELQGLSPLDAQKCLTGRIKSARTLHDFSQVVAAGGRLVDSICLVAILAGLPRAVQRATLPVATPGGPGASRAQLSAQDAAELSSLVSSLEALVRIRLREFDSNGLVTVAVGFAKLSTHVSVGPDVFRTLLAAVEPRLSGLATKALANLVWAVGTAGVQPCGSWLSGYYGAVERQLEAFSGGDLANLMWGLAKFDLMPEVWLMDQLVAASLAQLSRSHSVADGATTLTCLARYYITHNYRLPDERLGALLAALQPGLRIGSPGDLVSLLHSAMCLSHMPSRAFMMDYYAVLKDRLGAEPGALSHADFSRLLWSLSRVDCVPPRSWLREFVEVSAPKLPHLRHRALTELVWALACWDARPSARWLAAYFAASSRRQADYRPSHIADTLTALAKLGCVAPTGWLAGMLSAFCAALPDARSHELVAVLESVVAVCGDRAWLGQQQRQLQLVADTAASKFALFDCIGHAKLVLALARANCCPGPAWLTQQQASLALCWSAEDIDGDTAAGLRQAYRSWEVELDGQLAAELEGLAS